MVDKNVLKREEITELLKDLKGSETLEKESAISWDGRNLIIRVPREIADYLKINEKNRLQKSFKFIIEDNNGERTQKFEIVERTKPIKKKKKNGISNKKTSKENNKSR